MNKRRTCQGCTDRTPGCHDRCEDYQERTRLKREAQAQLTEGRNNDWYEKTLAIVRGNARQRLPKKPREVE